MNDLDERSFRTLLRAEQLGQALVKAELSARGDRYVEGVLGALRRAGAGRGWTEQEVTWLTALLDAEWDRLGRDYPALADEAATAEEAASAATTHSWGADLAWLETATALAICMPLLLAKLSGKLSFGGGKPFSAELVLAPGVPKGVADLAKIEHDIIASALGRSDGGPEEDGKNPMSSLTADSGSDGVSNSAGLSASGLATVGAGETGNDESRPASRESSNMPRAAEETPVRHGYVLPMKPLQALESFAADLPTNAEREHCLQFRNRAFALMNEKAFIAELLSQFAGDDEKKAFYGNREDNPGSSDHTATASPFRPHWDFVEAHGAPLSFGVGALRVHVQDKAPRGWRPSIRLQTPRRLKGNFFRRVYEWLHRISSERISTRWMTPALLMASNSAGDYLPWAIRPAPAPPYYERFASGAPVNIAGGGSGAFTLFLRNRQTDKFHALTVGHTLRDDLRGAVGDAVFCPPQGDPSHALGEGVITALSTFPDKASLLDPEADLVTPDYALMNLRQDFFPRPLATRGVLPGHAVRPVVMLDPPDIGMKALKAAAKTPDRWGTVRGLDIRINVYNPLTHRVVTADPLTEFEVVGDTAVLPGDSGSLMLVDREGSLYPQSVLVAATRLTKFSPSQGDGPKADKQGSKSVFALPLAEIPGVGTGIMELA